MGKTIAIIAARMGSTRFPGKVLMPLGRIPVLEWVINAAFDTYGIDEVVVATTTESRDDEIKNFCNNIGIHTWRGSETDVLKRFADAGRNYDADLVVRLTGDCPLLDRYVIGEVIALQKQTGVAFANNTDPPTFPDGLDCEVVTMDALAAADREATRPSDRDTVCQYISRNRHRWPSRTLISSIPDLHTKRWVLDGPEDYEFCTAILAKMGDIEPSLLTILDIVRQYPELEKINHSSYTRNERFLSSIAIERMP